jgi:CheY-like chemotaxis protein
LVSKKILIVDTNKNAALASEKLFAYFKAKVTILSVKKFIANPPNFAAYDIVALSNGLFTYKILSTLEKLKVSQELKVISLDNLFTSDTIFLHDTIDIRLKKPLTQEYVFDTLIELYNHKKPSDEIKNKKDITNTLLVHRARIQAIKNINLESFKIFRGKHLLIVEDNIINQKVVLSVLAKSGMILHVATNGKEAVDFMRSSTMPISFIFMDINMPIMDGYRATALIRSDKRFAKVPIVALSALVSDHEIAKMFEMGTNAYLPKPVRIDTLYSALKMFLIPNNSMPVEKSLIEVEPLVLEGLNINSGLTYLKGNEMFYKEVLKEFMDAYSQSDEVFERLVKEQRFSQVQMLIFDLKGLTGSIGAKEMYVLINEIYQHLVYNKPELLHSYISRYYTTFSTLRNSITKYLAS